MQTTHNHSHKVITYVSDSGLKITLCSECEARHKVASTWPRDARGREYCQVYEGLRDGVCTIVAHEDMGNEGAHD